MASVHNALRPNYVHLAHMEAWRERATYLVDVATAVTPEITQFQVRGLRSHARDQWLRLGGCWCVASTFTGIDVLNVWSNE